MTNHIEQMMKAAGIEPVYSPIECLHCDDKGFCPHAKALISKGIGFKYPSFTPAKQLELIKLIGEIPLGFHYTQPYDIYALQVTQMAGFWGRYYVSKKSFEDLIAIVIFELLKVNKLDKAEVKRILEDD